MSWDSRDKMEYTRHKETIYDAPAATKNCAIFSRIYILVNIDLGKINK